MSRRRRTHASIASAILAAFVLLGGALWLAPRPSWETPPASPPAVTSPAPSSTLPPEAAAPGTLASLAASLPLIDEETAIPDYRRDSFGGRWVDLDGNGCDQRQDVLSRDLVETTRDRCTVLTGTLHDPYTGATITFQHDRVAEPGNEGSQGVQIDHIVSLSAAHAGGAWQWTPDERETFANTLTNLLAVDGETNQSKSDRGPSEWMPPSTAYACDYAQRYTEIVSEWRLSVLSADRDALTATLTSCGR